MNGELSQLSTTGKCTVLECQVAEGHLTVIADEKDFILEGGMHWVNFEKRRRGMRADRVCAFENTKAQTLVSYIYATNI